MSSYVAQFLSLKCVPDILGTVGYLGNKPEKEISEAWAVIKRLRDIVLSEPDTYQLIDMCSGNALVPVTATYLLPFTKTFAIDKSPRERNWSNAKNFEYVQADIYDMITANNVAFDAPTILTGVHCCGNTAEKIIDIFNSVENIKHLILMPCCLGRLDSSLLQFIKEQSNRDLAWVTKLVLQCSGKVKITRDNHILSPKNYVITATKGGYNERRME